MIPICRRVPEHAGSCQLNMAAHLRVFLQIFLSAGRMDLFLGGGSAWNGAKMPCNGANRPLNGANSGINGANCRVNGLNAGIKGANA